MMTKKEASTEIVVAEKEKILCDICQKPCKGKLGLTMHMMRSHSSKKSKANKAVERKAHEKNIEEVVAATIDGIPLEIIAYAVGQVESLVHRIAFENGLPAKHFAKRCAEYFLHAARR